MREFARRFDVAALAEWVKHRPGNAITALFEQWVLPGQPAGKLGLRIGIRDRYLNLYVKGQSAAELRMVGASPRLKLHHKYYAGVRRRDRSAEGVLREYQILTAKELADASVAAQVINWVETAETYASAEKRFVDDLVAANAGVLDLEMGLPASTSTGDLASAPAAPRMDLVVVQTDQDVPALGFWEAKCSINGELRSVADYREEEGRYISGPKVIHQLLKYQRWMTGERIDEVRSAYRSTAVILLELTDLFAKMGPDARDSWRALAHCKAPEVVLPPGLLVGNYCPAGHLTRRAADAASFVGRARSFPAHLAKLASHGITVREVFAAEDGASLPSLRQGRLGA